MKKKLNVLIGMVVLTAATSASADITLYRGEGFRGSAVRFDSSVRNLQSTPLASSARAIVIDSGAWQVCDRPDYEGRCVIVRAGSYDSTRSMGLDGIVSARAAVTTHVQYREIPPPMVQPNYYYYQRPPEPLYEAPVLSVRAILGPPEQRCWVERERVVDREPPSGKRALAGAIIGGILGHQLSDGKGAGTAGGAIAGAAIGANVGRDAEVYDRDVQHCEQLPPGPPDHWDVTYEFRGARHHVQMSEPPGRTITVNDEGVPRG
jgi:uncharacterized protein YcfJ